MLGSSEQGNKLSSFKKVENFYTTGILKGDSAPWRKYFGESTYEVGEEY
jgi:hypothetical protein